VKAIKLLSVILQSLPPDILNKEIFMRGDDVGDSEIHSIYLSGDDLILASGRDPESDHELLWSDLPYKEEMHRRPLPEPTESEKLMARSAMIFLLGQLEGMKPYIEDHTGVETVGKRLTPY